MLMNERLTQRERRFVAEYLVDLNASAAAVRAGYSSKGAAQTAHRLRRKPAVAKAIREALAPHSEKLELLRIRLIEELARCALADPRSLFVAGTDGRPVLRPLEEMTDEAAATIAEVVSKTFEGGQNLRVRQYGKVDAAKVLAKLLGLSPAERVELSGELKLDRAKDAKEKLRSKLETLTQQIKTQAALEHAALERLQSALAGRPELLEDLALWRARLNRGDADA